MNRKLKAFVHPGCSLILPFNERRPRAGRSWRLCCSSIHPMSSASSFWVPLGSWLLGIHPTSLLFWPQAFMVRLGGVEVAQTPWMGAVLGSAPGIGAAPGFHVTSLLLVSLCCCHQLPFPTSDVGCWMCCGGRFLSHQVFLQMLVLGRVLPGSDPSGSTGSAGSVWGWMAPLISCLCAGPSRCM